MHRLVRLAVTAAGGSGGGESPCSTSRGVIQERLNQLVFTYQGLELGGAAHKILFCPLKSLRSNLSEDSNRIVAAFNLIVQD